MIFFIRYVVYVYALLCFGLVGYSKKFDKIKFNKCIKIPTKLCASGQPGREDR